MLAVVICATLMPVSASASSGQIDAVYQHNLTIYESYDCDEDGVYYYLLPDWKSQSDDPSIVAQAETITGGISGDYEKAKAIHEWVCRNISYGSGRTIAADVLQDRVSVCEGYTNLTVALLRASGIPAKYAHGFALGSTGRKRPEVFYDISNTEANHAWTEAFVDGRWIIMDTTWDSTTGRYRTGNYKYFDISLREISKSHKYARSFRPTYTRIEDGIARVVFQRGITHIEIDTIPNKSLLTSVSIPDTVTTIGAYAFSDCTGLKNIIIPGSVTRIGEYAFSDCTALTNAIIQDGVSEIMEGAFIGCRSLIHVDIPDSVTEIGSHVFEDCSSLERITLPSGIKKLREGLFAYCTNLRTFIIPDGVTEIEDWVFEDCDKLASIVVPKSVVCIRSISAFGAKIYGERGSAAEVYANDYRQRLYPIDQYRAPALPTVAATPSQHTITLDGVVQNADAYTIGGNNYFKLRDVAAILSGTDKAFDVGFDTAKSELYIYTGRDYKASGSELSGRGTETKRATRNFALTVFLDGKYVFPTAYNIGGNNYFHIRDMAELLDFYISYDAATKTVTIDPLRGFGA